MHELAIAQGIVGIALREARGRRVRKVHVVVGHLRQVVPSALAFSFELATAGTEAEGAELELEEVAAAGVCRSCGTETVMRAFPLACSGCGGLDVEITRGEELRVDWLELDEPAAAAPSTKEAI